jgi:dihydroorotate dehydrogenase (fumarate)
MTTDETMRIAMSDNRVGAIVLPSMTPQSLAADQQCIAKLKHASSTGIPVFASLRVPIDADGSVFDLASKLESSGVAAIEVSVHRSGLPGESDPRTIENGLVELIQKANQRIGIPLFVKLTSNFTSISHLAKRLSPWAQGLIMFGRKPLIDIELDSLHLSQRWGLTQSGSVVNNLEAIMRTRAEYPDMSLIACGGVADSEDAIKAIMAGANTVMVTSAIYRNGVASLGTMKDGLARYMSDRNVKTLLDLQKLGPNLDVANSISDPYMSPAEAHQETDESGNTRCDRFGHPV